MVLILISDGNREDEYLQSYPEIVEKREFAEGDIRTLYIARFDGFDEFEAFLNDITTTWTVKIWCPEYANTSLALACEERALVMEICDKHIKVDPDAWASCWISTGSRRNDCGQGGYI